MWNIELFKKELEELVNIDSGTENLEGVAAVGKKLTEKLEEIGFRVETFDEGTRIQAVNFDMSRENPCDVMLVGHMDTVFEDGTAAKRPYREDGVNAYGPGVLDMKAGLMTAIHLVRQLAVDRPELKICCAFNGDEETGSYRSEAWFEELAEMSKNCLVLEPGRLGGKFVKARKGCMDLIVEFFGVASHAGVEPEKGANAILEAARWITELSALQNLEEGTSVNAGVISGGKASNVIPDYAKVHFDVRFTQKSEYEKLCAAVRELEANVSVKGVTAKADIFGVVMPMNPSPQTQKMIEHVDDVAAKHGMTIGWVETGGLSDANFIAGMGVPTICGCGPCGDNMHRDDEYLILSTIEERLILLHSLLLEI